MRKIAFGLIAAAGLAFAAPASAQGVYVGAGPVGVGVGVAPYPYYDSYAYAPGPYAYDYDYAPAYTTWRAHRAHHSWSRCGDDLGYGRINRGSCDR